MIDMIISVFKGLIIVLFILFLLFGLLSGIFILFKKKIINLSLNLFFPKEKRTKIINLSYETKKISEIQDFFNNYHLNLFQTLILSMYLKQNIDELRSKND